MRELEPFSKEPLSLYDSHHTYYSLKKIINFSIIIRVDSDVDQNSVDKILMYNIS